MISASRVFNDFKNPQKNEKHVLLSFLSLKKFK
jgi:hypothetical protein